MPFKDWSNTRSGSGLAVVILVCKRGPASCKVLRLGVSRSTSLGLSFLGLKMGLAILHFVDSSLTFFFNPSEIKVRIVCLNLTAFIIFFPLHDTVTEWLTHGVVD